MDANCTTLEHSIKRFGLTEVYAASSDTRVDVVFVHGLNGHPYYTWTDTISQTYWPATLLGPILQEEKARISVYGYAAQVASFTDGWSGDKIHNHAEQLVAELAADRRARKATQHPINFVAHSLGGLIVERALIHSSQINGRKTEHLRSIFTSTYGVLFLGTPHKGLDINHWRLRLEAICQVALPGEVMSNSLHLIDALKSYNETLQNIDPQFVQLSHLLHVYYFHEGQPTDLGDGKWEYIVDVESASPTIQDVERAVIQKDHMHMCKFENSREPGFHLVAEGIHRYASEAAETIDRRWHFEEANRLAKRKAEAEELLQIGISTDGATSRKLDASVSGNDFQVQSHLVGLPEASHFINRVKKMAEVAKSPLDLGAYTRKHQDNDSAIVWFNSSSKDASLQSHLAHSKNTEVCELPGSISSTLLQQAAGITSPILRAHSRNDDKSSMAGDIELNLNNFTDVQLFALGLLARKGLEHLLHVVKIYPQVLLMLWSFLQTIPVSMSCLLSDNITLLDILDRGHSLQFEYFKDPLIFKAMLLRRFEDSPGLEKISHGHFIIVDYGMPDQTINLENWSQNHKTAMTSDFHQRRMSQCLQWNGRDTEYDKPKPILIPKSLKGINKAKEMLAQDQAEAIITAYLDVPKSVPKDLPNVEVEEPTIPEDNFRKRKIEEEELRYFKGVRIREERTLYDAALAGDHETLRYLLGSTVDVDDVCGPWGSPLTAAVISGSSDAVRLLLTKGSNPLLQQGPLRTPLRASSLRNHPQILSDLISIAKVMASSPKSVNLEAALASALLTATRHNRMQSVQILLLQNANPFFGFHGKSSEPSAFILAVFLKLRNLTKTFLLDAASRRLLSWSEYRLACDKIPMLRITVELEYSTCCEEMREGRGRMMQQRILSRLATFGGYDALETPILGDGESVLLYAKRRQTGGFDMAGPSHEGIQAHVTHHVPHIDYRLGVPAIRIEPSPLV